jgi:signal transduction histidine kinase
VKLLASLTNRIFLASSLLAVISIAVAVFVVNARVTRDAEDSLKRYLENTATLLGDWEATLSDNFQLAARLIADSPKLKAAMDTGDPQTVEPIASEYRRQTKADVLLISDRQGRPLAVLGPWVADTPLPRPPADAAEGRAVVTYWPHPTGVLQMITVPVLVGSQTLGEVSVGFVLDRHRAAQLRQMTESEIAFAIGGRVVAATIGHGYFPIVATMLHSPGVSRLEFGGEDYVGMARPLAAAAAPDGPAAILLQSRTERLRFLRQIHAALGLTAFLAVVGAIGLSYMVARTVTRPLAAITAAMREVAATGDLTRKVELPAGNWEDEDARLLATTLNTLTDSIATFQREAAQRERLSSLGRLSTVIAHEIRNPLMIIKASLRTLRRDPLRPEEVREASADIGEEVERLNRIVAGVLDFARPIRFEPVPTDLRALCQQSVAAATADGVEPHVRFVANGEFPVIVTDGERLRAVLVNLITNARQAVTARREREGAPGAPPAAAGAAPDGPGVEVTLSAIGPRRMAIEVADRGVGIRAAELPRIFEPYFTTKRGGNGLGLAIARNVVDGLGGRISIMSREGEGTTVRVEIQDAQGDPARPTQA